VRKCPITPINSSYLYYLIVVTNSKLYKHQVTLFERSYNKTMAKEQYIITKRIAKQGKHSILIIPSYLQDKLKGRTLVKVTIDVLEGVNP